MTDFHAWLRAARPGAAFVYYSGNLAAARGDTVSFPVRKERTAALDEADAAWEAAMQGLVVLAQRASAAHRPSGEHTEFTYIAQRTHRGVA